jgi:3-hydroxyacyl-[acyl-carrier-protein] dehydratase
VTDPEDAGTAGVKLDREQIQALLPHRPPFLLVDDVIELEPGQRCVARRELRADDFWFAGHFPGNPVMPGVLIVEALAQTATLAAASAAAGDGTEAPLAGKIGLFAGIDKVRFKRVVKPGDTLRLEAEMIAVHGPVGKCKVLATVDGQMACRGELMFAIVDAGAIAAGEARL